VISGSGQLRTVSGNPQIALKQTFASVWINAGFDPLRQSVYKELQQASKLYRALSLSLRFQLFSVPWDICPKMRPPRCDHHRSDMQDMAVTAFVYGKHSGPKGAAARTIFVLP